MPWGLCSCWGCTQFVKIGVNFLAQGNDSGITLPDICKWIWSDVDVVYGLIVFKSKLWKLSQDGSWSIASLSKIPHIYSIDCKRSAKHICVTVFYYLGHNQSLF